jgi:hypothetical protein
MPGDKPNVPNPPEAEGPVGRPRPLSSRRGGEAPNRSLGIPPTDPRYRNLVATQMLGIPIFDKLPTTWAGADLVAVVSGIQGSLVYSYYVWDGTKFVPLVGGGGLSLGNVVGPVTAVNGDLVVFDGVTGKLIKDGGAPYTDAKAIAAIGSLPRGPIGETGEAGDEGQMGMPGQRGRDGVDGKSGAPGEEGPPGEDAPTIPGLQGIPGVAGVAGAFGIPGTDGEDGQDGFTIPINASSIIIDDEGTTLPQRNVHDFIGVYTQAWDDAANLATRIRTGYAHYDAIVDSTAGTALYSGTATGVPTTTTIDVAGTPLMPNQFVGSRVVMTSGARLGYTSVISSNTTSRITFPVFVTSGAPAAGDTFDIIPSAPVFKTLQAAIYSGADSILVRGVAADTADITIATDAVTYILGASPSSAINVNLTVTKQGVLLQNLLFNGTNKQTTLNALGTTAIGCVWGVAGAGTHACTLGTGASLVACVFTRAGATASITVSGGVVEDCRIQACQFVGGSLSVAHILATGSGTRGISMTGNLFVGFLESGFLVDLSNASGGVSSINGNFFDIPQTAIGAIKGNTGVNISGNFFNHPGGDDTRTLTIIANCSREVVTGNTFNMVSGPSGGSTQTFKWIVTGSTAGRIINGNTFICGPQSSASGNWVCIELAGASGGAGSIITGNAFVQAVAGTKFWVGINALMTGGFIGDFVLTGNSFSTGSSIGSVNGWLPIHNTAGNQSISRKSIIHDNPGLPDINAYALRLAEDFVIASSATGGGTPAGWKTALTLGTITYPVDTQNGVATLATGALILSGAVLFLDTNHIAVNPDGAWQVSIPRISSVANVRIHVGFMLRAGWAGLIAAGTWGAAGSLAGANFTDWFALELDTGLSANWFIRWRKAGAETIFDTTITPTAVSTQIIMGVDRGGRPWAIINGQFVNPATTATNVPTALLTIGAGIEDLAAADKQMDIDMFAWGDARV